ncbi:MAG: diaminobutyrate--2-oxoglutarate transaminase [Acutalibacteraceae bacterium]|nr:diaminobutyrate--2-oxoglutarate transaminase [Acutalibacteraceae bacterium]
MNTQIFEQHESEVRSYCRHFPTVFSKAKGSKLFDELGNEYIDFFCGAGAVNYGHNNNYIKPKLIEYLEGDGIMHALDMYTTPKREFISFMQDKILKPRGLDYKIMFPGPTGTNAVEAALKLARKVKGRSNVFALMGCFHGMTLGALALTTDQGARKGAGVKLNDVTHIPAPYMYPNFDTIEYMQNLINDDHSAIEKPAAVVIETVQAEGGIQVFEVEYLQRLRKFCDDNDILLMIDDIQVGCARTGTYFSFERANIQPDILVLSKSIGGYGLPFALTMFKPELDKWTPGEHNGTFRGNQLAFVAAKAGLEFMLNEKIEEKSQKNGEVIKEFLEKEILPLDSRLQIRGIGMIWGIEFENIPVDGISERVTEKAFDRGLIVECAGRKNSVVKLMPPLVIEKEVLQAGLEKLKAAVEDCLAEIK